jgi:hypothetical protein
MSYVCLTAKTRGRKGNAKATGLFLAKPCVFNLKAVQFEYPLRFLFRPGLVVLTRRVSIKFSNISEGDREFRRKRKRVNEVYGSKKETV